MKICVAQTRPVKGDVQTNIDHHLALIKVAVSNGADIIIFPELSLTGYEPELAKELATNLDDNRFDVFQSISDTKQIIIGAGMPTKSDKGICISMIIFQPGKARQLYSKQHLHADEKTFFVNGGSTVGLGADNTKIALAICYEISVAEHAENAYKSGAEIYLASVAKTAAGVEKAAENLSGIARKYGMSVLMSNCVGPCDNSESGGKTSIWNNEGQLIAQLNDTDEGILILDTDIQEISKKLEVKISW